MNVVTMIVTSSAIAANAGYVGTYATMDHCMAMQAIVAEDDPSAVVVCQQRPWRPQPVLIPPPRPADLRPARQPVLIPPPRP
jgi:hypothetical protein